MSKCIHFEWSGVVTVRLALPVDDFSSEEEAERCRSRLLNGAFEEELTELLADELETNDIEIRRESVHVSEAEVER